MKTYESMTKEELLAEQTKLLEEYKGYENAKLALNMARGKPDPIQLDLCREMFDCVNSKSDCNSEGGIDTRNYGEMEGIPEAKRLMAQVMECDPSQVIVFGNASLNIMYDTVSRAMVHGVCGGKPWGKYDKIKFLCPVPGYDRHFAITECFGIEMINVPMTADGPDMDMVEALVAEDETIKGIWCVPKYSNPTGITFSDETVRRFATMKCAAEDFRIFWDNAYCVHHLYEESDRQDQLLNILEECAKAGNPDRVYEFASTSKVTLAGAGISAMAASENNLNDLRKIMTVQTIGHDKVNQLRHVRFLKDRAGVDAHMLRHAAILRPKFELVERMLSEEIVPLGIGSYTSPNGGYFISFEALEGCAKSIVAKAKAAGVVLTGAGAPFPYGKDPKDKVIRLAPSYPGIEELEMAAKVFICCVKLASVEKFLEQSA
ncbi:MAG: aminotransferase [bacterium]|nr:aminotransferase [bacterium]